MITKTVKIIDEDRNIVATAQVVGRGKQFTGLIDLTPMPNNLRQKFEEYEEIINDQMFSFLDEIEDQINAMLFKVVFDDGREAAVEDLQIYPSTGRISFKLVHEPTQRMVGEPTLYSR
jgi:hypothetical protein